MISTRKRSFLKSIAIILSGTIVARGAISIYKYLCMRTLTMEDYGMLTLVISLFLTLLPFASFSSGNALSKFLSEAEAREEKRKQIFIFNALVIGIIGSTVAALLMYFFLVFKKIINLTNLGSFLIIIACFLLHAFLFIISGAFKGFFKMTLSALIEGAIGVSKLILALIFVILGSFSLRTAFLSYSFGPVIPFLIITFPVFIIIKKKKINFSFFDKEIFLKIFRYSRDITLATVIGWFFYFFQNWRLSLDSLNAVAIYGGALMLYSILQFMFSSYVMTVVPYISRHISEGNKVKIPRVGFFLLFYIPIISLILLLKVTSLDKAIFSMLHLENYFDSLSIFYILLLSSPLDLLFGTCSGILQGSGHAGDLLSIFKKALFVHIIIVMFFGFYGAVGIAIAQVFTFLFLAVLGTRAVAKLDLVRWG